MAELRLGNSLIDERYEVSERKGMGSYAEIFTAHDRIVGELVIIKALNTSLQGTPDPDLDYTLVENFRNEATALDTVRHPNIIRRLGSGSANDLNNQLFHYIVLEYMPGGDLLNKCKSQPFSFDEMILYVSQVCDALAHAHECNVIHRDIKPNNLLLSADAKIVKVADFGVAKIAPQADEDITRVGTDVYAPPEHHPMVTTGELVAPKLTPSADVYSLAKTIYTLMTGLPPRRFKYRPITELPAELMREPWSQDLLAVLRRATETKIEQRYSNAAAFLHDLMEAHAASEEVTRVRTTQRRASTPPPPPLSDFGELRPQYRNTGVREAKIVVQMPERKPVVEVVEEKKAPLATKTDSQSASGKAVEKQTGKTGKAALPSFWDKADAFIVSQRRTILTVWALLLFIGFSVFVYKWTYQAFQPPGVSGDVRYAATTRDVIVRSGPGTANSELGFVRNGARVEIIKREANNWCLVRIIDEADQQTARTAKGWIYGGYIDASSDSGKKPREE